MDPFNKMFGGMRIAASGMEAERARMDVIARNIAHAQTTRMPDGSGPYKRQIAHFGTVLEGAIGSTRSAGGVEVLGIHNDDITPFDEIHNPGHPDADAKGYVSMPNVNTMTEMADMITAVRAYEANISLQQSLTRMAQRALRLAD
ncbi:MAG: flagellar basal-body rod protein FlgC [Planctomycetota bacterium]|jgi:flagellar basal-body rod protein FlgC